ncbi:PREDICTED: uncharacterized protein LOC107353594 [Acropora digitifera]|uniref:uncharacterized protein LOC107353594 n=1 Tax=Acropora digitifera TaxID=70779 RepID=UPI00077A1722|nr:PREDICTED: uncharacterized protein LOC107353594 [Acropora digitifera]
MVNSTRLGTKLILQGSQSLMLGGKGFKGKITQLMLFNLTLTKEQIQGIKGRIKLPVMMFNSTIILNNSFYRAELASFLAAAVGQMKSKWNLCYHAPTNGWKTEIFHRNCDNKTHTVTIIKKDSFIFGGYTDIPWESSSGSSWGETLNAFIFSLNNREGLPPFKCFAKNTSKAIYKNSSYGPSFGEYPGLRITSSNQNTSANAQASISKPYSVPFEVDNNKEILAGTSESFFADSYEVFYLA